MREYLLYLLTPPGQLATVEGPRLQRYLESYRPSSQEKCQRKGLLIFDSTFESGSLLSA